jgi:signal transduction histidine kinase
MRALRKEIDLRKLAEQAYRGLSHRLLQVQDAERRRLSRELHDSVGQALVSLKMGLETLSDPAAPREPILTESIQILDQSLVETRTMSYLLHPPLLDEAGFASAAGWFVEGFSKRSGIALDAVIPADLPRLPSEVELALFRILQECLTNIHRHSGSSTARVEVGYGKNRVTLRVQDRGKGLSADALRRFRTNINTSVGLAGMRERVEELGGNLMIKSGAKGTLIVATIPLLRSSTYESSVPITSKLSTPAA